jgi:hypothetical protein
MPSTERPVSGAQGSASWLMNSTVAAAMKSRCTVLEVGHGMHVRHH